jgi:hypothetical protein
MNQDKSSYVLELVVIKSMTFLFVIVKDATPETDLRACSLHSFVDVPWSLLMETFRFPPQVNWREV